MGTTKKLSGKEKIAYGIGAVGKDMVYMLSASYVLYYFQDIMKTSAIAMEGILLQGLSDDEIREFMHVLDVMQTNLVSTGLIGDESRYSSLALCEAESRERQSRECESQPTVRKTSQEDETGKEE